MHSHNAILMQEGGKPVLVKCRWDFTSHPAIVAAAMQDAAAEVENRV